MTHLKPCRRQIHLATPLSKLPGAIHGLLKGCFPGQPLSPFRFGHRRGQGDLRQRAAPYPGGQVRGEGQVDARTGGLHPQHGQVVLAVHGDMGLRVAGGGGQPGAMSDGFSVGRKSGWESSDAGIGFQCNSAPQDSGKGSSHGHKWTPLGSFQW